MVTRAEDNPFPSLLFVETADPATPDANSGRLFLDTDGILKWIDDAGTVTAVSLGGAGLSDPMTTRGDIIVRNASNVTARLPIGSTGKVLSTNGTDVSWQTPGAATSVAAHGARVTRSADVSVGSNTLTLIPFTAEDYDTDTMHDNSTNNSRLTIPTISGVTTGLWRVTSSGYTNQISVNGRNDCAIRMNANGSSAGGTPIGFGTIPQIAAANLGIGGYFASCDYVFSAADYVETFVRTTGGSFSAIFDAGVSTIFSIAFLGKVT